MAQTREMPKRADGALACQQGKAAFAKTAAEWKSRSTDNFDAHSYTLTIDLDFDARTITARCDVGIESTEAGLIEFTLDFVDLTVTGVMEGGSTAVTWTHENGELRITPSSSMSLGESRVFSITYEGTPTRGLFFTGSNGGTAYTMGQPEDARYWFPCRDVPDDKADWYRGHITAPSDLLVASNGELQGIVDNGDGTSTTSYFLDYPVPSYLVSVAVSDYQTFEQTSSSGIPIKYFVYPDHYDDAVYDWANVPAMMDFYETVFEPYPFSTYGHAVAPFGGAMENETICTWSPQLVTGDRTYEATVAHELSHQWWGDLVTCGTWMDIWLNEGAATYFDALFTEHFYGEDAFRSQMVNNRWDYFQYEEFYEGRFPIYDPDFMWGGTVYRKGAWILHMIRSQVGYETFVEIYREWADRYRYDSATTADFQQVIEDVTGEDWDWFFDQWVYMAGYPEYRVSWTTSAGNLHITIDQIQEVDAITPLFTMPLDLLIKTPGGDVETTVQVDQQSESFIFSVPAEPTRVIFDPGLKVLCKIQGENGLVVAPGPDWGNRSVVRAFDPYGAPLGPEITAYGVPHYGANVAAGDLDGDGYDEILTGAGPGPVFGAHVRGFEVDGSPLAGLSFLAYGTPKWGVNVGAGDFDGDGFDEILTGAGPGAVFGPHVRAFDYDGSGPAVPMSGVSYFAYGTLRYGVNVTAGDIDGDGFDEIVTGAGPGAVFGAHVRGWNVDGGSAAAIPAISFFAYGTPRWGVNVACGDIDADGMAEIITAPGPGASFPSQIRGFNYDGADVEPIDAINIFVFGTGYGGKVSSADMDGDGTADILVAPGPQTGIGAVAVSITINPDGLPELQYAFEAIPGMDRGANLAGGRFPLDGRASYSTESPVVGPVAEAKGKSLPGSRFTAATIAPWPAIR
jgi:hypothetical protein